jgi:uncharacterized repeat protein (TIGR02543 family)
MDNSKNSNRISFFKKGVLILLLVASTTYAQKQVYIPSFITRTGMDLNDPNSQWSYSRMAETENIVIFWEPGFGSDPSVAPGDYRINMDNLKAVAEKSYATYVDSLRFVIKGSSVTDDYKLMIFLLYTTDWGAWGSGQDDLVGTLHVNPAAANINTVVAHEIGHTFQYLTGCDSPGGFRYGFGDNASGGNGYWEQIAQWMSFQAYPERQFTAGDFNNYIQNNHLHLIHEDPRYANYFIGDYWAYKHGPYFQGELWRDSREPEDPIEAYKRLTGISQTVFNDEIYEHAARLTTWDLPKIRAYGKNYIDRRAQVTMNKTNDDFWIVDPAVTIENYGYNSIKLNAPASETVISVGFQGKAGISGYRSLNIDKGGWRFGFVALLNDESRVYSEAVALNFANNQNPEGTLTFTVPNNCSKLWFVVSGAPQEHWRHAWDDDNSNDEQWPYQVKFANTNLLGEPNPPLTPIDPPPSFTLTTSVVGSGSVSPTNGSFSSGTTQTLTAIPTAGHVFTGWSGDAAGTENPLSITMNSDKSIVANFSAPQVHTFSFDVAMSPMSDYTATQVDLTEAITETFNISQSEVEQEFGGKIQYYALNPDGSLDANSTANAPGHWYSASGAVVAYGANAYVYSELDLSTLSANIGQYPDRSSAGDSYTLKQALVYTKSAIEIIQINFEFTIAIIGGTVALLENQQNHSFLKMFRADLNSILGQSNAFIRVYDLKGNLLTPNVRTENISDWSDLGFSQSGIYRLVLIQDNQIKAVRNYTFIEGPD